MMKKEIWKVSITLPQYEISNMGRVRNTSDKKIKNIYDNHKSGYIYIQYSNNGKCRSKKLHRLVAELFCDNPDNKETVNHINGIKSDNRSENLEWLTHLENMKHAYENGLIPAMKGEKNGRAKLTDNLVHEICKDYVNGLHYYDVMEKYNITKNQAEKIYRRTSWKHISSQYSY